MRDDENQSGIDEETYRLVVSVRTLTSATANEEQAH